VKACQQQAKNQARAHTYAQLVAKPKYLMTTMTDCHHAQVVTVQTGAELKKGD